MQLHVLIPFRSGLLFYGYSDDIIFIFRLNPL